MFKPVVIIGCYYIIMLCYVICNFVLYYTTITSHDYTNIGCYYVIMATTFSDLCLVREATVRGGSEFMFRIVKKIKQ